MQKLFNIYLSFLQVGQSETLLRHVFAGLRAFLNNYSIALFQGVCVCHKVVKLQLLYLITINVYYNIYFQEMRHFVGDYVMNY